MRKEEKGLTWTLSVGKILNKPSTSGDKGFSLLELILVLFLMGLIVGLALPFVVKTLDRVKLQSETRQIASTLQFARSEAISKKKIFTFNADIDQNKYWLAIPKEKKVIQSKALDESIRIREYKSTEDTFTSGTFIINFYPLGNSSAGTIHLQSPIDGSEPTIYAISIDAITGKPKIKRLEE